MSLRVLRLVNRSEAYFTLLTGATPIPPKNQFFLLFSCVWKMQNIHCGVVQLNGFLFWWSVGKIQEFSLKQFWNCSTCCGSWDTIFTQECVRFANTSMLVSFAGFCQLLLCSRVGAMLIENQFGSHDSLTLSCIHLICFWRLKFSCT